MIEAGGSSSDLLRALQSLDVDPRQLEGVFLTHGHFDHVMGLGAMLEEPIPVYLHHQDLHIMPSTLAQSLEGRVNTLKGGERFKLSSQLEMRVIHTPGHTPGSCCYYIPSEGILFSGDTVFTGGYVGRTDLPGGSFKLLVRSLQSISQLDFQHLLPSHGPPAIGNGKSQLRYALSSLL